MMFIVALYVPWCRYLAAQEGVEPQVYRVFRHIGGVYTIIGAFCQETQARATSPNGCKPLQADKWPRLQRGAKKCMFHHHCH